MAEAMNPWIARWYEENAAQACALMHDIWEHPELGLEEEYASRAVGAYMERQGFRVELKNAEHFDDPQAKPNTVIATWGSGKPVIGILGELDALPGLGQQAVPYPAPIEGPGHGCGHNLMAGGAASAAAALKYAMEQEHVTGTVRMVGCPAEEIGRGRVALVKDGVFDGMDIALAWHPRQAPFDFDDWQSLANNHVLFEFHGVAAHAKASPWSGRSALDSAQLMNMAVEFQREHNTRDCRVHYVFRNGGRAPNVVPDYSAVYYYIRALNEHIDELTDKVMNAAKGAAMMMGTTVDCTVESAVRGSQPNTTLNRHVYRAALKVPPLTYTPEEYAYARSVMEHITGEKAPEDNEQVLATSVLEPTGNVRQLKGSTDVSEVTRILPTCHFFGGGRCVGMPSHHWGVTALTGCSIGEKTSIYAHKIIAQAAWDALMHPEVIDACWDEFRRRQQVSW